MKIWIDKELFQWEKGREVHISLTEGDPQIDFLQFYNSKSSSGPEVPLVDNKAQIPDALLKESLPIMVLACAGERGQTLVMARREFKVIKRAKPEIYANSSNYIIYDGGEEV